MIADWIIIYSLVPNIKKTTNISTKNGIQIDRLSYSETELLHLTSVEGKKKYGHFFPCG